MLRAMVVSIMVVAVSGCETLGGAWTKGSSIAFDPESGGSLSIWNSDMSAAVEYTHGQMCMQRALAVKALDTRTSAKISDAVLEMAKAISKGAATGSLGNQDLITLGYSVTETAQLLTTSTERTAFIDFGLFYVCQISANGGMTDAQTAEVIKALVISGASLDFHKVEAANAIQRAADIQIPPGDNPSTPRTPKPPAAAPTGP